MTNEELLRERVAKLEVQMDYLTAKLDDTHQKVEEMHAILVAGQGRAVGDYRIGRTGWIGFSPDGEAGALVSRFAISR